MDRIACISGTSRPDNYTAHAMNIVMDELRTLDVEPVLIDGRDITLPFPGQPDTADAQRLREIVKGASGVVIGTPEYHGSFAAMTKLIIENLGFPSALEGKPVALLGVAGGRIGAIKSLEQLRGVCSHTGAIVMPGAVSIAGVRSVFDAEGRITDDASRKALHRVAHSLVDFLKEFVRPRQVLESMVREESRPWTATV
jgi:NAD(P)H-dependent FMN reductase